MKRLLRAGWAIVLVMMLAAAAWSISGQLTRWGMRPVLAYALSLMFDAAGLVCAEYARRAVERNTPAGLPRLAIFGFVSVSGVLNYSHGLAVGGIPAACGLASISFAVELLFELHRRDVRDQQRADRGLVAERMPHIPVIGWVMFPGRAWATLRGAVAARLDQLDPVQSGPSGPRPDKRTGPDNRADGTVRAAVRAAVATLPGATAESIAAHLTGVGIVVDPGTVRTVLAELNGAGLPVPSVGGGPAPTITDTVRTVLAQGVRDPSAVLARVHAVHGPGVDPATVDRLRRRHDKSAAGGTP